MTGNQTPAAVGAKNFFYRVFCGAFLGLSVIAPGISGSIMAVMLGIYDDLLDIISAPFKNFRRNFFYLLPLCIGAAASALLFLQALNLLFQYYPTPAYLLFISLIASSMPTVFAEAKNGGFKKKYIIGGVFAFLFALGVGLLVKSGFAVAVDTSAGSASRFIYLPICGAVAGITGMIPGMSVSMMLMMLGSYKTMLRAAAALDIVTMAPVAVCFAAGMIAFSRFTKFFFKKYRGLGYFMVLGFMCGSIISIFPAPPSSALEWALSAAAVAAGLSVSFMFKILGKKFNAGSNTVN